MWERYLPSELHKEHLPRVTKDEEGGDAWQVPGSEYKAVIGLTANRWSAIRGVSLGRLDLCAYETGGLRRQGAAWSNRMRTGSMPRSSFPPVHLAPLPTSPTIPIQRCTRPGSRPIIPGSWRSSRRPTRIG